MNVPDEFNLDRRTAIKSMLAVACSLMVGDSRAASADAHGMRAKGYGFDPDLFKTYKPGDVWPLTLNEKEKRAVAALCDTIIPADATSPSASAVGVPDFIDEWVSAPYPAWRPDRKTILDGIAWIDAESEKRFQLSFAELIERQRKTICDDICYEPAAKAEFKQAARFFKRFRDLTAGGYYTTPEGMKAIQYVGNVPLASFEGPPAEVLRHLGLDAS